MAKNAVKKRYAEEYINESLGNVTGNDANEQMAEMIFHDRFVASDEELKSKLNDHLASKFVEWSDTIPPFKVGSGDKSLI